VLRWIPREIWLLLTIGLLVFGIHALNAPHGLQYQSDFLSPGNLTKLSKLIALLGVFALGSGIIIIAGGIDLSAGSVICFSGVMCAKMPQWVAGGLQHWIDAGSCPSFLESVFRSAGFLSPEAPYSWPMLATMIGSTLAVGVCIGLFHGFSSTGWISLLSSRRLAPWRDCGAWPASSRRGRSAYPTNGFERSAGNGTLR
jgi:ribose/xylose/arabinose/galactoside ABC-type transport system permease subunit